MKMIIEYQGKEYITGSDPDASAKKVAKEIYENINQLDKLQVELEDGRYLVIGKDVFKKCVFLFSDDE